MADHHRRRAARDPLTECAIILAVVALAGAVASILYELGPVYV